MKREHIQALTILLILLVPLPALADGESLFVGTTPFQNGGLPCASCHACAGLPFPGGGGLGPDLSREAAKLGPEGLDVALQTLYFPTMLPIFRSHPLTSPEQAELKAFLVQAQNRPLPAASLTAVITGIAVVGFLILLVLTGLAWRRRAKGVRAPLVQQAMSTTGER